MKPRLLPTTEPYFFPRGPTGCLMVHGFTGTPKELRWMGEYLAGKNYSVLGIRLTGHATRPEDILRSRWEDWLACLEDGWNLLQGIANPIYLVGLSMGSVLSLLFAALYGKGSYPVAGVVAMSTAYRLPPDPRLPFINLLRFVIPHVPKGPPDFRNPEAVAYHREYPTFPTRSIMELRDLLVEMRRALPQVEVPVMMVHSRTDTSTDPAGASEIYSRLGSTEKSILWLDDCGHVLTEELQREEVFAAAADFIERTRPTSRA